LQGAKNVDDHWISCKSTVFRPEAGAVGFHPRKRHAV